MGTSGLGGLPVALSSCSAGPRTMITSAQCVPCLKIKENVGSRAWPRVEVRNVE